MAHNRHPASAATTATEAYLVFAVFLLFASLLLTQPLDSGCPLLGVDAFAPATCGVCGIFPGDAAHRVGRPIGSGGALDGSCAVLAADAGDRRAGHRHRSRSGDALSMAIGGGGGPDEADERTPLEEAKEEAARMISSAESAEKNVRTLEERLRKTSDRLTSREKALSEAESTRAKEESRLLDRIADLRYLVQKKDLEVGEAVESARLEAEGPVEALEGKIDELTRSIESSEGDLWKEREEVARMRERLLNAEDELEYEQMRFEGVKSELSKRILEERAKLDRVERDKSGREEEAVREMDRLLQVEAQLKEERQRLEKERKMLEDQIEGGAKVRSVKARQMARRYDRIKEEMTSLWNAAKAEGKKVQDKLNVQVEARDEVLARLQEELGEARSVSDELSRERERVIKQRADAIEGHRKLEAELSGNIADRDVAIADLEKNIASLKIDATRHGPELANLKAKVRRENGEREKVSAQLMFEQIRFQNQKKELEKQIDKSADKVLERTRQMSNRFNRMREEMTALLVKAKSDAIVEKARLRDEFETVMAERNGTIASLQVELDRAEVMAAELNRAREDVMLQISDAREEIRKKDVQLSERNVVITRLTDEANTLENDVNERDAIINRYESNFREQLKLSVRLTGRRLRRSTARVRDLVRRKARRGEREEA